MSAFLSLVAKQLANSTCEDKKKPAYKMYFNTIMEVVG